MIFIDAPLGRALRGHDHVRGELEPGDDEQGLAVSADDQEVAAFDPIVEGLEAAPVSSAFGFATQVTPEHGHTDVAAKPAARGAAEGHALAGETAVLQEADDRALSAIPFVS